jgi:acyl-CoA reductase LuxC
MFAYGRSGAGTTDDMSLPNYFIADLPPEATLSSSMIEEACRALKRNRERYLANRSTHALLNLLGGVSASWLEAEFPFRRMALEQAPLVGFSRATLAHGLDLFFGRLTAENLEALLEQDLGNARLLDEPVATIGKASQTTVSMATGPEMLVHITAGNLPPPTLMSIVLGLLVRSAQFVKCASGTSLVPRLFAHSLYEADPKIGACLEIAEWHGGDTALEQALFTEADCITATGTDDTLASVRKRLPAGVGFVGYGHKVSFGYISNEVLSGGKAKRVAQRAADDVVAWNQLGCLSPHIFYVQDGGLISPELFAEMLSEALVDREQTHPRGEMPAELAAAIASRRAIYELRAAHSPGTRLFCSKGSTVWTVVYEADAQFQLSCLNRFVYVKTARDLTDALQNSESVRGKVSTVGVAAEQKTRELATELARWGASRVCPLGQMQNPPLTWRHDGRPALGDLVRWTDWEVEPK